MLTPRMAQLHAFIERSLAETGVCPSFDEMRRAVGLRSKSGVFRLTRALEQRGYIRRLPNRARAIEVVRSMRPRPALIDATLKRLPMHRSPIAAATERANAFIDIPRSILPDCPDYFGADDCFAVKVVDGSMGPAGIFVDDVAIFLRTTLADSGHIALVRVNEQSVMIRRLRRRDSSVALEAADPSYETRIFGFNAGRVEVLGRLVGLVRQYPYEHPG